MLRERLEMNAVKDSNGSSSMSSPPDMRKARIAMVDGQLRTEGVRQLELLNAFLEVPREAFVPRERVALSYLDAPMEVSSGRFLPPPALLARLIQELDLRGSECVLDVGCSSGYSSAILSQLVGSVVALECDKNLLADARRTLESAEKILVAKEKALVGTKQEVSRARESLVRVREGLRRIELVKGPLEKGYSSKAPYDAILIAGAIDFIPDSLSSQLREGGRLVAVEGKAGEAMAKLRVRQGDSISSRSLFSATAPELPGFRRKPSFVF